MSLVCIPRVVVDDVFADEPVPADKENTEDDELRGAR